MKYIKVRWVHSHQDEPVWLYSELTDDLWETRKVEVFLDGSQGYASQSEQAGTAYLSSEPWPSLEEIAADSQFVPEEITIHEFEEVWAKRGDTQQ